MFILKIARRYAPKYMKKVTKIVKNIFTYFVSFLGFGGPAIFFGIFLGPGEGASPRPKKVIDKQF